LHLQKFLLFCLLSISVLFLVSCGNWPKITERAVIPTETTVETTSVEVTTVMTVTTLFVPLDSYQLDVECILQKPELPTGCEVTSLTMLLNYLGFDIDKETLYDDWLPKAGSGLTFYDAYIGDARSDVGFGCYSPVIVKCANAYLASQDSSLAAHDLYGADFEGLFRHIQKGYPVIVWATLDLLNTNWNYYWTTPDGEKVSFCSTEHCLLLTGYDIQNNTVTVCDPMRGVKEYKLDKFKKRYEALFMQAVIITEADEDFEYAQPGFDNLGFRRNTD